MAASTAQRWRLDRLPVFWRAQFVGWGLFFVLDLLKIPKVASNPTVRRLLDVLTPVVTIGEVRTEDDHLVVALRPHVGGVPSALSALRRTR